MTIAQCKAARKRMIHRYGDGRRFGWSVHEAIEKERERAARELAAKSSKKASKK